MTRIEGFEQPLAAFAVQVGDALAEPRDRLLHVGALALHLLEARGQLGLFLLGAKIDAAKPLAIASELSEPPLDLGESGEGVAGFTPASRKTGFRRAVELLADGMRSFAPPLARRFEQRLASGPRLARCGKPLLHLAQGFLARA